VNVEKLIENVISNLSYGLEVLRMLRIMLNLFSTCNVAIDRHNYFSVVRYWCSLSWIPFCLLSHITDHFRDNLSVQSVTGTKHSAFSTNHLIDIKRIKQN